MFESASLFVSTLSALGTFVQVYLTWRQLRFLRLQTQG